MRTISILLTLSLLAIVPSTTAEPGYECKEQGVSTGLVAAGIGRDCKADAEVLPNLICTTGTYHVERDVRGHEVAANMCRLPADIAIGAANCEKELLGGGLVAAEVTEDCKARVLILGGLNCIWGTEDRGVDRGHAVLVRTCKQPYAYDDARPGCPKSTYKTKVEGSYVDVAHNCSIDIHLFPEINCIYKVGSITKEVSRVSVTVYYCDYPVPVLA